jgi:hypothetical protein
MGIVVSPWAAPLKERETMKRLKTLNSKIPSRKVFRIYRDFFRKIENINAGLVNLLVAKEFKKINPNLSWEKIMKAKPEDILKS